MTDLEKYVNESGLDILYVNIKDLFKLLAIISTVQYLLYIIILITWFNPFTLVSIVLYLVSFVLMSLIILDESHDNITLFKGYRQKNKLFRILTIPTLPTIALLNLKNFVKFLFTKLNNKLGL